MDENLTTSLQENILTLLIFDRESAPLIISNIKPELFSNSYYRIIAEKAIEFFIRIKEPAGEHVADLLEKELSHETKGEIYKKILISLYENKETISKKYILEELDNFIRTQNLKITVKNAFESLQQGKVDDAEDILEKGRKSRLTVFDPGTMFLKDMDKTFDFIDNYEENLIYTGIKTLDDLEHVPTRGELYTLMGRPSSGKSWFLIHLAKFALLQRKKVLHLSLEMNESRMKARYFQTLFGIASKTVDIQHQNALFVTDRFGNLTNIEFSELPTVKTLRDHDIVPYLIEKAKKLIKPNLILKDFPSGSLSIRGLNAYLNNLEGYYNFIPDIILLDYLDLMEVDVERLRIDLGQTGIALRGIAGERNLAMVTVAQTNSAGEDKTLLTRRNIGEDYSRIKTTDVFITYNQTPQEKNKGLARLFVEKGRNGQDGSLILVAQNYSVGQFCLNSVRIGNNYKEILEKI